MAIEDELDMEREKLIDGDLEVDIPDNIDEKNLELIVTLALKSYKEQLDAIGYLELKNRMKAYEVAERYLGQAKDARYKLDRLKIEREKGQGKSVPKAPEKTEEAEVVGGKTRKELMAEAQQKVH